ncbi:MAG: hypothetical protein ACOC53_03565 [Candidatus Saliniplasma sp.]
MVESVQQLTFGDFDRDEKMEIVEEMSEKERIEFIRENGTDAMKSGLNAVFDGNRWKPKRENMWLDRLDQGKRMVKTILENQEK